MICRSCGTEIADKAIVCYRCGAPTADPRPAGARRRARPAVSRRVIAAVALVLAAAVLVVPRVPAGAPRVAAYVAVVLVVFLVMRTLGRWPRR